MNFGSNSELDRASEREQQERDAIIAQASRAVRSIGTAECVDCGIDIARERRIAQPSATRCIGCQTRLENGKTNR